MLSWPELPSLSSKNMLLFHPVEMKNLGAWNIFIACKQTHIFHFSRAKNSHRKCLREEQSSFHTHKNSSTSLPLCHILLFKDCISTNLEASINLTCMFVDCGRDETTQGESMHTQGEHANSTQRSPSTDSNQEPSCCEVTVLTPTPLCYPQMTQREEKTPQRNRLWGRKFKNKAIASLVEGSVTWEMTTESNAIFYTETDR